MPLYTMNCPSCGEYEDLLPASKVKRARCPNCGGVVKQEPARPTVVLFRAGFYEHVGENGVHAETPQQLQDACNANGSYSTYIENSSFKVRRNYDGHEETKAGKRDRTRQEESRASEHAAEHGIALG